MALKHGRERLIASSIPTQNLLQGVLNQDQVEKQRCEKLRNLKRCFSLRDIDAWNSSFAIIDSGAEVVVGQEDEKPSTTTRYGAHTDQLEVL